MSGLTAHLAALFEEASASLPDVEKQRMFGCDAFFARGNIFGLISKEGRIGVKLPDPARFDEAMSLAGADRWSPGGRRVMAGWVLLPDRLNDDVDALKSWIEQAHRTAAAAPPKASAKRRAAAKAPIKKTSPARRSK